MGLSLSVRAQARAHIRAALRAMRASIRAGDPEAAGAWRREAITWLPTYRARPVSWTDSVVSGIGLDGSGVYLSPADPETGARHWSRYRAQAQVWPAPEAEAVAARYRDRSRRRQLPIAASAQALPA